MNIRFLFLFLLISLTNTFAQNTISGKIVSTDNLPIKNVQVFFNNTTVGTLTDNDGNFQLKIAEGNYTLIVSHLGFETKQMAINTATQKKPLLIQLKEKNNVLNEVEIKKVVFDTNWWHNYYIFRSALLGRSSMAKQCDIINKKVLRFDYNPKTNQLEAYAKKPLKIKNKGLGYMMYYDLVDFRLEKNKLVFSGYAQYKNLKKRVRKKWKRNRKKAFFGSQMHFLRSLLTDNIKDEGYIVHQFKRVKNTNPPKTEVITSTEDKGATLHFDKLRSPRKPKNNGGFTAQKSTLPKFTEILYKRNIKGKDIISLNNNTLLFDNYLMVIYTKEKPESSFLSRFGSDNQTSKITLLDKNVKITKTGVPINPNAIFNEGYWAYESLADMLPLDYKPPKD